MQVNRIQSKHIVWLSLPLILIALWLLSGPLYQAYLGILSWIFEQVRLYHTDLTTKISAVAKGVGISGSLALVVGSFLYGVFHAAGPGHGKVILSTYLLSQPENIGKSVRLAAAASLVQGAVAIALVYGLFYLFGLVSRDMKFAVAWSERLAYLLVILIGLSLLWRGIKAAWKERGGAHHDHADHHHHDYAAHDHHHDHTAQDHHHHDHAGHDHHDHGAHDHHHHSVDESGVCSTCGHAHMPTPDQVNSATDLRTTLGVIFSIGMRPCSGAVLVLVFARFSHVEWAGVLAVLAMSVGTAITVSALAIASVGARGLAVRLLGSSGVAATTLLYGLPLLGGLVLTAMGLGLLAGSFDAPARSMGL